MAACPFRNRKKGLPRAGDLFGGLGGEGAMELGPVCLLGARERRSG